MHIVAATQKDRKAIGKVLNSLDSLLSSMPSYRGDFVEPENLEEYIAMWEFAGIPIMICPKSTNVLEMQFPIAAEDYKSECRKDCAPYRRTRVPT